MKLPRFSLRMLFVLIALVSIPLAWSAYQLNWIRQRHAFMAEQLHRQELAWPGAEWDQERANTIAWWRDQQLHENGRPAPWRLRLFGEQSVNDFLIIIPDADLSDRDQAYVMSASQADWQRAKVLFPEAEITPISWDKEIPKDRLRPFFHIKIVEP